MPSLDPSFVQTLEEVVGTEGVRTEARDLAYYGTDRYRGDWPVAPSIIVLPKTVEQVAAVVARAAAAGVAIVPSGGRTGLAGAATATAGELVLSLERMNRILAVDVAARTIHAEAGVTIEAVQQAAAAVGLQYPVDWAATGSAQVGGSIATNAGGIRVLRYGGTRSWVAGVKVVVGTGTVLELGGALVKDNTGYDLRQLFIGSEGTLGVVVEATLRLTAPPRGSVVALCAVPRDAAVLELFTRLQATLPLLAFECFDQACLRHVLAHRGDAGPGPFAAPSPQHALVEVEVLDSGEAALEATTLALSEAEEAGLLTDAVLASTPAQARELWAWRESISESLHRHGPHKADIAVPVAKTIEFLGRWRERLAEALPEAEPAVFGHIGDGNLHLNVVKPAALDRGEFLARCHAFDATTYALVQAFSGSISAEHGIGLLKRDHLHFRHPAAEVELMRAIKAAFDPRGIFNPGKIFPAADPPSPR